jgi:hypothetical protein
MAELMFFPPYAEVLAGVVRAAEADTEIDVECRTGLDPVIIAQQLRVYGARVGRPLRCVARADRVEVTVDDAA